MNDGYRQWYGLSSTGALVGICQGPVIEYKPLLMRFTIQPEDGMWPCANRKTWEAWADVGV